MVDAKPNPVPLLDPDPDSLTVEEYEKYKKADCAYYRSCLDLAAKANWKQFSCTECNAFNYAPMDESEREMLVVLGKALAGI